MEPKNVVAVKDWVREQRPDVLKIFDTCDERIWSALLIGFEAGRTFQFKNPNLPINQPEIYFEP